MHALLVNHILTDRCRVLALACLHRTKFCVLFLLVVVEHAYTLANGTQKREMVCEFYSPEYRLFKGVASGNSG
jgi:hypothetical protein